MKPGKLPAGLSLWLLPDEDHALDWQALIDALARRHEGASFKAHVTTATLGLKPTGGASQLNEVIDSLSDIANAFEPLTLPAYPPTAGPSFFQCVYAELPTPPVATIGQSFLSRVNHLAAAAGESSIPTQCAQRAHMSLLYGDMPAAQRTQIAETIRIPNGPLRLDALCLVGPGQGHADFADPLGWEVIASAKLAGEPSPGQA